MATDAIGMLTSLHAGSVIGTGWPGADVTVAPLGEAGSGFVEATADALGAEVTRGMLAEQMMLLARADGVTVLGVEAASSVPRTGIPFEASSADLGRAIADALEDDRPRRLVVDLVGPDVHDGGAGLLGALGATADVPLDRGVAGLFGLTRLDLTAVRAALAGVDLVGAVPTDQVDRPLLGLRGITSARRGADIDPALLLATDQTLASLARLAGLDHADVPGGGACGGLGLAVLALGGRLVSGPGYGLESAGRSAADLVVTGCTTFDFARRGGGVVATAAHVANQHLAPCIALAAEVLVGARELRTMGIESAYAVRSTVNHSPAVGDVTEAELLALAQRVGRSWRW
ncbi:MAG TPA: glycerate kinase [Propionibacteriaceae bacterium]|nr:glycerate kinase [Propionibacteriaceae bacterium]